MKKLFLVAGIILLLFIAAETNPTKDEFIVWSEHKLMSGSQSGIVNWGVDMLGGWVLHSVTKTENYLFFSIYSIDLPGNKPIKVLGIFKNFIPLP